jgi:hypothetical protein
MRPARAGGPAPDRRHPAIVSESTERRNNHDLRLRIDQLLGRVRAAEADIVERGLSAVHDASPAETGRAASTPAGAGAAVAEGRAERVVVGS